MKRWIPLLMMLCMHIATAKPILQEDALVKVLIERDLSGSLVEVKGSCKIFDIQNRKIISSAKDTRLWLTLDGNTLKFGDTDLKADQIAFVPGDRSTTFLVDGIQYQGVVYALNVEEKISLVNGLGIEDYIETLLTDQVEDALDKQALDALAIVLRTNVVHNVQKLKKNLWHFDGTKVGFKGYGILNNNDAIVAAIQRTKSLILQPKDAIETLGFNAEYSLSDIQTVADDQPRLFVSFAELRAKHHQSTAEILAEVFPNCQIDKFDHKVIMEVEPVIEE